MENFGKFGFSVQSSGKVAAKRSNTPELVVTPTKGQIKINDATSRMLQVASRENIVLLGNRRDLENYRDGDPEGFEQYLLDCKAELVEAGKFDAAKDLTIDDITIWGIAKGWPLFTKAGAPAMCASRLTNEEREALKVQGAVDAEGKVIVPEVQDTVGFRVSANGGNVGIGHIMTGNDTTNYPLLKGNGEENFVYSISRTPILTMVSNGCEDIEIKVYPLTFEKVEEKLRVAKDGAEKVEVKPTAAPEPKVYEYDGDDEDEVEVDEDND